MSRSRTYRPIALTAEELARIEASLKQDRSRRDILPGARGQCENVLTNLPRDGSVPVVDLAFLARRVEHAGSVEELRELAVRIAAMGSSGSADRIALQFDAAQLTLELDSLGRKAAELRVTLPEYDSVLHAARSASELVLTDGFSRAAKPLEAVREAVVGYDALIHAHSAEAECRARTAAAVLGTLHSMGYEVVDESTGDGAMTILARAESGRVAEIEISNARECDAPGNEGDAAANVVLESSFTDPADALPSEHPDSGKVCEPAVQDQLLFQRGVERASGLRAGVLQAEGRPTRGPRSAASVSTTRRARQRAVPKPSEHRSIQ